VVGRFNKFQGDVNFVPNGESKVTVDIDVASIDTKVAQRDQHLRSADFFNVTQFPKARFESTHIDYDADGNPKSIQGTLTLHGQSKAVTLTVSPIGSGVGPVGEFRVGFHASTIIQRSDFGMTSLMAIAGDQVTLNFNVEAIHQ
jgi:polyisoprenoid-binding protein YceI